MLLYIYEEEADGIGKRRYKLPSYCLDQDVGKRTRFTRLCTSFSPSPIHVALLSPSFLGAQFRYLGVDLSQRELEALRIEAREKLPLARAS